MIMKKYYFITALWFVSLLSSCQKQIVNQPEVADENTHFIESINPFPGEVVFEVKDPLNDYTVQSPSILILSNGDYLVSFYYDRGTTIYISKDRGGSWAPHSRVAPSNFATLFEHRGDVYLMGTSKGGRGDIAIYKSTDLGQTWSTPTDENNGLLFEGMFHTAPVPVVKHNGKIWRAYEEIFDSAESRDFFAFAVCADEDADLLKASSWQRTNSVFFEHEWINAKRPNWLEGNIVVTPEGSLINFMRLETWPGANIDYEIEGPASGKPRHEIAAFLDIDTVNMTTEFNNEPRNYVHFPGAESKFTIRYDSISQQYWTITNKISSFINTTGTHDLSTHQRNVLVLMQSSDLVNWEIKQKVLRWNEGAPLKTWDTFGFQYMDWQFDGDDIVFVSRTSWYGHRFHDANMITFHRIENFRSTSGQEPDDLIQYTQHPTLFNLPVADLNDGNKEYEGFDVAISVGDGIDITEGKITLADGGPVSMDEAAAMAANRYFDVAITSDSVENFSLETIDFTTTANTRNFRLKWLYSTDGSNFLPITNYTVFVDNGTHLDLAAPMYLPVYTALNNIPADTGAVLRCVIVRGNSVPAHYMQFDNVISFGGRDL